MKNSLAVHLALLLTGLLYAVNYTAVKRVTPEHLSPESLIFIRMSVTTVLFWITYVFIKKEKIHPKKDYARFLLVAFFGTTLNVIFFFKGLSITTQTKAAFTMMATPIFVLVLSSIWLKERFTRIKLVGIVLAATGYALMVGGNNLTFESHTLPGDLMVLVNALSYGTYLVLVKPLMEKYHPITVFRWIFLMGSTMVFFYTFPNIGADSWQHIPPATWGIIAFIILGATYTTFLVNAWALRYATATIVSIYIYMQPILASVLALLLGDEVFTPHKALYGAIILTGVWMVSKKHRTAAPE